MSVSSDSKELTNPLEPTVDRRLYRSNTDRVVAGIAGGLGDYFAIDPVWFRIAFVVLTIGGGAGVLIYLIMWVVVPPAPDGYAPNPGDSARLTGAAVLGMILIVVGAIALINTIAPSLGQYFWPVAFVLGGLALVLGGMNRDNDR